MLFSRADNHQNLPLPSGGSDAPSNAWFLGPTRVSASNGISIGLAVLCRAYERDQQTDRPTTLLANAAMWPDKNNNNNP